MINWTIAKNPLNYLVIGSMAAIGLAFVAYVTAPMRRVEAAQ